MHKLHLADCHMLADLCTTTGFFFGIWFHRCTTLTPIPLAAAGYEGGGREGGGEEERGRQRRGGGGGGGKGGQNSAVLRHPDLAMR